MTLSFAEGSWVSHLASLGLHCFTCEMELTQQALLQVKQDHPIQVLSSAQHTVSTLQHQLLPPWPLGAYYLTC